MSYFIKKNDLQLQIKKKEITVNVKKLNTMLFFLGLKLKYNSFMKFSSFLNYMFGIGYKRFILFFISRFGISFNFLLLFISLSTLQVLQMVIRKLFLNYDYRKYISSTIFFQKKLKLYSGLRHSLYLSVRGQRTKTNCGTQKKKRYLNLSLDGRKLDSNRKRIRKRNLKKN